MRNTILISLALAVLAFTIAISWSLPGNVDTPPEPEITPSEPPPLSELIPEGTRSDGDVALSVLLGEELVTMTMERFLIGVVASEMPASFEVEALKAQAVAARTDIMYNMYVSKKPRHPDADVCGDYTCCMAYKDDQELRIKWGDSYVEHVMKIIGAVVGTDGMYMAYDAQPILAVFHSSSAGRTENSGNVWSADLPYLVSVPSPETADQVPDFVSAVRVSQSDFLETALSAKPGAVFGDDPASWITDVTYTVSGRISTLMLGGAPVTGPELRSMFGLRSTAADITIEDGDIVFTTTGYGHGVGLSQYGANAMAENGKDFREILAAYYTGVTLVGEGGQFSV